jgi:putative heme-binding domain-containing protein
MPRAWPQLAQRFLPGQAATPEGNATAQLSALFGDETVLAQMRALLADTRALPPERKKALDLLKRARDPAAVPIYLRLLEDPEFRGAVLPLLAGADDPNVSATILRHFPELNDGERAAALAALTSHPTQGLALLQAVDTGALDKKHLTALHVRELRNLRNEKVDTLLDKVWGRAADSSADIKAAIARYQQAYKEAPRWAYNSALGRETFQQLCATCHKLDGQGGNLGPDLTGSWRNGLEYYIENIVDPNAVVGRDFQLNIMTKRDGSVLSGMIERESETTIVVRTPTETVSIPKVEVAKREVLDQSLMPAGLLDTLPSKQVIELLMFLTERS